MRLMLAVAALLIVAPSFADDLCAPLEYAEIKDTSTKSLTATFCTYQHFREAEQNLRSRMYEIAQRNGVQFKREVGDVNARIEGCFSQQINIERALKNRGVKSPACPK